MTRLLIALLCALALTAPALRAQDTTFYAVSYVETAASAAKDAAAALRAFHDDASPAEWRRFQREAERLAVLAGNRDLDDICTMLQRLGSRWAPSSREALMTLLREAAHLKRSDSL